MKKILLFAILVTAFCANAFAQQKMYEPKTGSAERKALMNAVRVYDVARNSDLDGEIFKVGVIKVQGN